MTDPPRRPKSARWQWQSLLSLRRPLPLLAAALSCAFSVALCSALAVDAAPTYTIVSTSGAALFDISGFTAHGWRSELRSLGAPKRAMPLHCSDVALSRAVHGTARH